MCVRACEFVCVCMCVYVCVCVCVCVYQEVYAVPLREGVLLGEGPRESATFKCKKCGGA